MLYLTPFPSLPVAAAVDCGTGLIQKKKKKKKEEEEEEEEEAKTGRGEVEGYRGSVVGYRLTG